MLSCRAIEKKQADDILIKSLESEKEELIQAKSIESLEGENKVLWDVKSQLSKNIQSLNTDNESISAELLAKFHSFIFARAEWQTLG